MSAEPERSGGEKSHGGSVVVRLFVAMLLGTTSRKIPWTKY